MSKIKITLEVDRPVSDLGETTLEEAAEFIGESPDYLLWLLEKSFHVTVEAMK